MGGAVVKRVAKLSAVAGGPIVILGAGLAGGNAARTLRAEGFDGSIRIVGDEPGVPFGRPPLSKAYLRGEGTLTGWLVEPASWYEANGVELIRDTASGIELAEHRVRLATGAGLEYSKLLL